MALQNSGSLRRRLLNLCIWLWTMPYLHASLRAVRMFGTRLPPACDGIASRWSYKLEEEGKRRRERERKENESIA